MTDLNALEKNVPILSVEHLKKNFGEHEVLRDITFDVPQGDVGIVRKIATSRPSRKPASVPVMATISVTPTPLRNRGPYCSSRKRTQPKKVEGSCMGITLL